MNVRTVTIGTPISKNYDEIKIFKKYAEKKLKARTYRINLPCIILENIEKTTGHIEILQNFCNKNDIRWFNLPFNFLNFNENMSDFILATLKRMPSTFINMIVAEKNIIDYNAITQASKLIKQISKLGNSGFNNFRVGTSCNPKLNTPYFPFSYSSNLTGFSIGLEIIPVINEIIKQNKKLELGELQEEIVSSLVLNLKSLEKKCYDIEQKTEFTYHGIDLSIAPFPDNNNSIGYLLESMGLEIFGSNGTLFFTSYLTDTIKKTIKESRIKSTGFNGIMYSLMEDPILSKRNNQNIFSIDSLISYSAVCGCGLDMVPIPGDTFEEEISAIILDIAGLSTVLSKPLGVRLLPIPGKSEGDITRFNMDFICNTRVKKIKNSWNNVLKHKFSYKVK